MKAESILLTWQKRQLDHDTRAHRDILNLDTNRRVKHMVLHLLKYAGKVATAQIDRNQEALRATLVDTFIICLATANTLNVNVGVSIPLNAASLNELAATMSQGVDLPDIFQSSLVSIAMLGGKMAKAIEATDHLEQGDPRHDLELLIAELVQSLLPVLGALDIDIETTIESHWHCVESKSIFTPQFI